jgi:AraC-like DNA-binding protein
MTPHLFVPDVQRPVRVKLHWLRTDVEVVPHNHDWAQVGFSTTGVTRLTVPGGSYIVPPLRAVWIPPGVEHAVTVLEDADLRSLYIHQPTGRCGPGVSRSEEAAWRSCRVIEVSDLMRALVLQMDARPDDTGQLLQPDELQRERRLGALVLDELRRAQPVSLGVDMPQDKRLRALCEAMLDDPTRHATLEAWAADTGASARTIARLFRQELGTSFARWRERVLLAKAVSLASKKRPMSHIAAELGYSSPSAFSAMVRRSVGLPPSRFFGKV